jgi:imidazolonepropionase-like amidohydrolase
MRRELGEEGRRMGWAIAGGRLIDGTGRDPIASGTVLVEGKRIVAVGPSGQVRIPKKCEVIDAAGMTMLPGFIDCHVHQTYRDHDLRRHLQNPPSYNLLRSTELMRATLEAGVTAARDLGGADAGMRRAVEEGIVAGPRLQVAIQMISQTGGHGDAWVPAEVRIPKRPWLPNAIADGVDQLRYVARDLLRHGADLLKICTTGGITSPTDDFRDAQYTLEEVRAVVYEAAARGKPVAAHAEGLEGIKLALEAGVHSIEHGWFLDEGCIEQMVRQGTWWVPTLALVPLANQRRKAGQGSVASGSAAVEAKDDLVYQMQQAQRPLWRQARERGVRIAFGTDQSTRLLTGENLVELGFMVDELGMTPMEAIRTATSVAAECLGLNGEVGTLEAGKLADLAVTDVDPLEGVHGLGDAGRIKFVMQGGRMVKDWRRGLEGAERGRGVADPSLRSG